MRTKMIIGFALFAFIADTSATSHPTTTDYDYCCPWKQVGYYNYYFVRRDPSVLYYPYDCNSDCIYKKYYSEEYSTTTSYGQGEDWDYTEYCFKTGKYPYECYYNEEDVADGKWLKVFYHNTDGGLFSSPEDALSKNVDDPSADLFSILDKLEEYKSAGGFHFRLCYLELVSVGDGDGCNEWIQTSNPATDSTITGFWPVSISFPYNSNLKNWTGIGKDVSEYRGAFIDDVPSSSYWWTAIGAYKFHGSPSTIPGPRNLKNDQFLVHQVELYVKHKEG